MPRRKAVEYEVEEEEEEDDDEEEEGDEEEDDKDEGEEEEDEEEEEEVVEAPKARKRKEKKWKDPGKPKKAMSAYLLFSVALRPQIKEENPGASFGDIGRKIGERYKAMTEKERKKWNKKAQQDKMRYEEEMKDYVPVDDPTGGGAKKKAKKDPNAPKRNMSPYLLYSIFIRPKVTKEYPSAKFGDIAKIISKKFKELSDKDKKKWEKKADEDKKRYEKEMKAYKASL